jgi:hypothetical protein
MREIDSGGSTGLRRGGMLAAGAIAASAFTTLCSLAATLLILRVLPREEAGRFAFLVELLYSVGLLCSLGQPVLQARIYQQTGAEQFDWLRDARSTLCATTPVVVAGVLAIAIPYRLTAFECVFLIVGAELFILTNCFSAVLGQQRHYAWSSALLRLGNGLLLLSAGLMLGNPSLRRLDFILVSLLVFLGVATLLGALLLVRRLTRGQLHLSLRQRISGLIFVATLLAIVVPQRGMIVVAGAMLNAGTVAALAAMATILRVFDLVGDSAGRVFSTEMARSSRRINAGLFAAPWFLAGLLAITIFIALPPIAHRFYGGRYDVILPLLPWLIAAAALRFIEIVPRGLLAYLGSTRLLNRFAAVQCIAAIGGVALMVGWTWSYDMKGLVWAAALIAAARLLISYLFIIPLCRDDASTSNATRNRLSVEPLETRDQEPPV